MSTQPNMTEKIIENATRDDVRPGDHLTWERVVTIAGVTYTTRREGIAHRRDASGNWSTEDGQRITAGKGEHATLTIRRPVQELPTKSGTVIVPADGREYIEAKMDCGTFHAREAVHRHDGFWVAAWRTDGQGQASYITSDCITPGTWKVEEEA